MSTGTPTLTRPVAYLTILLLALTGLTFIPTAAQAATNVNNPSQVMEAFTKLNDFRKSKGLRPVSYNTNIEAVSKDWTVYMADRNHFEHNPTYSRDSRTPKGWTRAGEIIAYNYTGSATGLINQWINSPSHNAIMSTASYTHVGIGLAKASNGRFYGTINFFTYPNTPPGHQTSPGGGFVTKGAIGTKYNSVRNILGNPTSNEKALRGGAFQQFQNGSIHWSKPTGAHYTKRGSAIQKKWGAQKYENGSLGYPTSDERTGLKNGGAFQQFQGGSVHWSSKSGAHITKKGGAIQNVWGKQKWENGYLGYPTSDELTFRFKSNAVYQNFQGGMVIWSSATKAHPLKGAIQNTWKAQGWERSRLGLPTSGEYQSGGKTWQNFQGGKVSWTSREGTRIHY